MEFPQTSFNPAANRQAAFSFSGTRHAGHGTDFDVLANFGVLKRRASDADVISDKESLYYQFRVDRVTKVRMTLENRLDSDPIAGFFRDRSLYGSFLNANGRSISRDSDSAKPEKKVALVSRRLSPGTYYLKLKSNFGGDIRYRVELKRTAD